MTATTNPKAQKRRWLQIVGALALAVVLVAGIIFLRGKFAKTDATQRKPVQQITVITPPPPPPPPPEPPKPEEKVEEEKIPDEPPPDAPPEPANNDQAPAGADLGVDADGGAGGDGFGLVGRKGGRDFLAGGGGGGSYTGALKEKINNLLSDDEQLKYMKYGAKLKLWIAADGRVERYEVVQTSGDKLAKALVEKAVASLGKLDNGPPADMPQPIIWQITSSI